MKKITVILLCMAMLLSGYAWSVKAEAVSSVRRCVENH